MWLYVALLLASASSECPEDMLTESCNTVENKLPVIATSMRLDATNQDVAVEAQLVKEDKYSFEHLISRATTQTTVVQAITREVRLRLVENFLYPAAGLTGRTKDEMLLFAFGDKTKCGPTNTGYVGAELEAIKRALDGNIREVWALIYCFVGASLLSQIMEELEAIPNIGAEFGPGGVFEALNSAALAERGEIMAKTKQLPSSVQYNQGRPTYTFPAFENWANFNFYNQDLQENKLWEACRTWNGGVVSGMQTNDPAIYPPLSQDEISYQCGGPGPCALQWWPGIGSYTLNNVPLGPDWPGVIPLERWLGYRVGAGPSATTANMMELVDYLSFTAAELRAVRLTMIAWLLGSNDHSLIEMFLGSSSYVPPVDGINFTMADFGQMWRRAPPLETTFGVFTYDSVWCSIKQELDTLEGARLLGEMGAAARGYVQSLLPSTAECERETCNMYCGPNTQCVNGMCVATCTDRTCCSANTCGNSLVVDCVGSFDPFCLSQWDSQCQVEAEEFCGVKCD